MAPPQRTCSWKEAESLGDAAPRHDVSLVGTGFEDGEDRAQEDAANRRELREDRGQDTSAGAS